MFFEKWSDDFLTNNSVINIQHQTIIKLLNKLHSDYLGIDSSKCFIEDFQQILHLIIIHLDTEEFFMDENADSKIILKHIIEHEKMKDFIYSKFRIISSFSTEDIILLAFQISRLIPGHIKEFDIKTKFLPFEK